MIKKTLLVMFLTVCLSPLFPALAGSGKKTKRRITPKPTAEESAEIRKHISKLGRGGKKRGGGKGNQAKMEAIAALGEYGGKAEMAVAHLERLLKAKKEALRMAALDTIGKIAVGSDKALAVLIKVASKDKKADNRVIALDALGKLGKDAVVAAPVVAKQLKDKNAMVRASAIKAIANIGIGKARGVDKELRKALEGEDLGIRIEAAIALGALGFKDANIATMLNDVLKDTKKIDHDRLRAAQALGMLGEASALAVKTMITVLGEKIDEGYNPVFPYGSARKVQKDKLRLACVVSLGQIGPKAKAALEALDQARTESKLRSAAVKSIEQIKGSR
jgi:HEAT repeat protein